MKEQTEIYKGMEDLYDDNWKFVLLYFHDYLDNWKVIEYLSSALWLKVFERTEMFLSMEKSG